MQTIDDIESLRAALAQIRSDGRRIALVPTMGALHIGHLALVELAKRHADVVIASIFVNPKQFGPKEDFAAYPRTLASDQTKLTAAGVALLWVPTAEVMYPEGFATTVMVAGLGDQLCGEARPGHFDGVATVVTKLFGQIRPDVAVFGEKDWQQLTIIRQLTTDLNLGVDIVGAPIVREADGLAVSSRNSYLDASQRQVAAHFPAALAAARRALLDGMKVSAALDVARIALTAAGIGEIDYLELIESDSLALLRERRNGARLVGAVRIGQTRLIDNIAL